MLHLLYSRFWHKVLFDLGHVSSEEPFRKLFNQGYVQAYAYRDDRGQPVPAAEVHESGDPAHGDVTWTWQDQPVRREYGKMGKSLKNVVTPDEMFEAFGADTFRVYEMSMGPLDLSRPWETRAVVGAQRFLQRLWRNVVDEETGEVRVSDEPVDDATNRLLHKTIDALRADYDALRFNTAIARLIELNNALTKLDRVPRAAAETIVVMTAPVAPHIAEELWGKLGPHRHAVVRGLPDGRPGAAGRRHRHVRGADPGQGARPDRGGRGHRRRGAGAAGAGQPQGRGCAGRQERAQGDRAGAQARQHRRRLNPPGSLRS